MNEYLMNTPQLSDYALIGNSRSAALVCKTGSIEWCCLPEFHSPGIFASILDRERGGFFSIAPVSSLNSAQKYLPETNVVETYFEAGGGTVRIIDAYTVSREEDKKLHLFPEHEILRVVEGISGNVVMKMEYTPRCFYGKYIPRLEDRKKLGIHFCTGENIYTLLSTLEPQQISLKDKKVGGAISEFSVKEGERVMFSLSYSSRSPAILPELQSTGWKRMNDTIHFWKEWIGHCQYSGLYEQEVRRSALVLKLLAHAPSGAIIAAPTTSIPEEPGGLRNWDYRYCWLRDASFTVDVLISLGFEEEAHAYMNWILHATQLTRPRLQVLYSVYGLATLKEQSLDWLSGYKNSRPVRIGNGADGQFQLDVYGEVLEAVYFYSKLVSQFDRDTRKFILGLGNAICELWDKPDNGIWEVRSEPVHHTHSKAMAWIGLDRLIKLSEKYHWKDAPMEKFRKTALLISEEIERCGYNQELASYTREFNGNTLDGSLLTMSLMGYCDPMSPRMMSTCQLILERLSKNKMVYRYLNDDDGLPGDEGSFGVCNFWLAQNFAKSGKLKEAMEVFEAMLKHASPAGLFSEEIDPDTYELLGNYPQGFTHIGLINAALCINDVYRKGADKR
jgi:GH15 family glucan-1,4-alpha-glucosidase